MKRNTIPIWTYLPEYLRERKEILRVVERVFSSGKLILGEQVEME